MSFARTRSTLGSDALLNRTDLVLCAILLAIAVLVFGKGITVGGPRWGDAGTHAMDGVLVHDWVGAGPSAWIDPVGFAERQYAHLPSLGMGSTYPPGFAVVEAVFFKVFGISVITARLCVLGFALAATGGLFVLIRQYAGPRVAACTALALLAMPSVVLWTRQTMLEMPTLAVLIWSAVAAGWYYRRPSWNRLAVWVSLASGAFLFKQTALFILAPYAALIIAWAVRRQVPRIHAVAAGLGAVVPIVGYFALISRPGQGPQVFDYVLEGRAAGSMLTAESWLTYLRWLPGRSGTCVLLFAIVGLLANLRRLNLLMVLTGLWFASFYVMSSLVQHKEPRYFFFGLLPVAVWAGAGLELVLARVHRREWRVLGLATLTLVVVVSAYRQPIPYRPDYGPLVLAHREQIAGRVVLFDGHRDSDFILAVRQHIGPRKCVVIRGSKLLYACACFPHVRFQSHVESNEDVASLLRNYAFDGVFVERHPKMNLAEEKLLRAALMESDDFTLTNSHTLAAGPQVTRNQRTRVQVDVYVPRQELQRTATAVEIPIPMDSRTIRVDLQTLHPDANLPAT
ncbi:MAG: hypothetical protein GY842_17945 [bacterium]|nr:hypothetical protein [bacterium]